jgi:hypothetical protein
MAVSGALVVALLCGRARADEPVKLGEPRVLSEPGEITNVIDAFDGEDVFDLHLTIGYQYTLKSSHIRRETSIANSQNLQLSTGDFTGSNMNVAKYEETTSRLNTRLDVGLYHDIALYFRMPIILSNDRKLSDLNGSAGQQDIVLAGGPNEQIDPLTGRPTRLFSLDFKSPTRSGIEYLAVGADFGFMNQYRDATKPTWMAGFEVRVGVGEPMHACNANPPAGQVQCAAPSDVNRNGVQDPTSAATFFADEGVPGNRPAGVSRGTTGLELHSFISRRIKYIEPYAGFRTLFEFPQSKSDFGQTDLKGSLVNHPPLQGWVYAGLEVIPWEHREQFQRVTFDARFGASYRSEGRDYSELFDALGSSKAASIRTPTYASYTGQDVIDPMTGQKTGRISVVDPTSQRVYFTGITDVSAFMGMQVSASVTWQAGEYIKFTAGGSYTREQSHLITADQPCNPDFSDKADASGPCRIQQSATSNPSRITGIPNPNYKPTIDSVGRRFKADDTSLWDAWVMGIVMF